MNDLGFARPFRLRPGGIDCNLDGLTVGDVALLERDAQGAWRRREDGDLNRELSALYGLALECAGLRGGLEVAATALANGDLARAQIATLLLRLPDPPTGLQESALKKRHLAHDLAARGLLKFDADGRAKGQPMGERFDADSFAPKGREATACAPDLPRRLSESDELEAFGKGAGAGAEKAGVNDPKHPGWPAKTPGSVGGQFRPKTDEERAVGIGHNQGTPARRS